LRFADNRLKSFVTGSRACEKTNGKQYLWRHCSRSNRTNQHPGCTGHAKI